MKLLAKIMLCITIFIIIGAILLAWKAPSIIRKYSEEYVSTKTKDKYKLQFEKVNISYLPFGVELENVSLQAIDSTYIKMGSSAVMVESTIDKVDISNINILRIITGSDVRFHLLFENPNFTILSSSDTAKAIQLKKGKKRPASILLKSFTLNNAHINYCN